MGRIVGDSKGEDSADEGALGNVVNGLIGQLAVGNGNLMAIQATKAGGTQTYLLNDSVMPVIIYADLPNRTVCP